MDREQQSSRAEQRMLAVAKLKRAASLPRMKDGRRPPMHVEAVSEGEKAHTDDDKKDDTQTPPSEDFHQQSIEPETYHQSQQEQPQSSLEHDSNNDIELEPEQELEVQIQQNLLSENFELEAEADVEMERAAVSPEPSNRSKRRSRSRSRSRGSKDFKLKIKGAQSPTPSPLINGDSSQDESSSFPPSIVLPIIPPLFSPTPSHFAAFQRSRLLASPIPGSPDPTMFYPGTTPTTPLPLPSLEALQRGLFRSNSAGNTAVGRRLAMHKLTGGTESYDASPPPTPPPLPGKLGRNNTVSGGEQRTAARQFMLSRLGGRIMKEADNEQASGPEDLPIRSPTPKKRRRRSRRGSSSAGVVVSDTEPPSTSPTTPVVPLTPLPFENFQDVRAQSATPNQATSSRTQSNERSVPSPYPGSTNQEDAEGRERPEPMRRRSVVVEDEDEETMPRPRYPGIPGTPNRLPLHLAALRAPHSSDTPSNGSNDSGYAVPVYLSNRTPSRNGSFPSSPFTTPLQERPSREEDEEQVLYTHRPRTPYEEPFEREISWVASPVLELNAEIRMPIHVEEDDEEREYVDDDEPPLSARSSNGFPPQDDYEDSSPRISSDSKSLVVESETSPDNAPFYPPPSPSSMAVFSQPSSAIQVTDDSHAYPARLSVASPIQSERSPVTTEFADWDERIVTTDSPSKRAEPGRWEKAVKSLFTMTGSGGGRRSRTNSILTRERRDNTDSSISRESGASLTSTKTDKGDSISTFSPGVHLPQSPSASASVLSLAPHAPSRGGASPIPPASSADLSKYQDAKLFPFPGMKKLEEERNRAKGFPTASASSPDVTMVFSQDEDHPPLSANTMSSLQGHEPRDRKLSHQASDTRLVAKYAGATTTASLNVASSATDHTTTGPRSSAPGGPKLPTTLPGVKQWLYNRKLFSSQSSTPTSSPTSSPPTLEIKTVQSPNKKPMFSDLLRRRENELTADWEEITNATPTTASGDTIPGKPSPISTLESSREVPQSRGDHTDTEKTPKAKKILPTPDHAVDTTPYLNFGSPTASSSPPDHLSSATPDLSSSMSDYPAPSTSESSSATSSQDSFGPHPKLGSQGAVVLERLDENLARGARSPMWASAIDDPARKLVLSSPVLQVVNPNTVKDRFLFLFSDILVIAKPAAIDSDNIMDSHKPSPLERKYVVKSVALLSQLRFNPDRTEPQAKSSTYSTPPRNPSIRSFVQQFPEDPDAAISTLFAASGVAEDSNVLGQILFKTMDLDRVRLGDYLARRTAKSVLKAYLDAFGFTGLRVDRALRAFLLSVHVPSRPQHGPNPLDYLLDAFASRWYDANAKIVAYDRDLALRLVRALVQLNELLHDGITQDPGPTGYPRRDIACRDFVDAFRRYETRYLVSDELLEDLYYSIREERLSQARTSSSTDIPIMIKRPLPTRLTYKIQSEPIVLRIQQPDPHIVIQLYGQDLVFDPPFLSFAKSHEASFRIMGTSLGTKTMIMCRSGANALKYGGLPSSNTVVVERAFMRNTFQIAFLNHCGVKRKYMFSVDDPLLRHQWTVALKRQIDLTLSTVAPSLSSSSPAAKFHRAAESVAFRVLQETLTGIPGSSSSASLDRSLSPVNGNGNGATRHRVNGSHGSYGVSERPSTVSSNGFQLSPIHFRSKSRSKVYHRQGAGRNELDLSASSIDRQASQDTDDSPGSYEQDQQLGGGRQDGPLWSGRDLQLQCQQNSSIALVLSFLQIGAPEHGQQVAS